MDLPPADAERNGEGGIPMPTYITLIRYTQQGFENIKDGPARLDAAKEQYRSVGAEIKTFYLVTGQYDAVVVSEAPNDETMAKLALGIGARGTSRSETLRAFTEQEYRKIVADLR
jgi:uncharacterized protein with GYD domain